MKWPADLRPLNSFSPAALDPSVRLALLAAHPDDETIGATRLLAQLSLPLVIFLTDGAPRHTRFWSPQAPGSREEYAALRREEAERALAHAGIGSQQIVFLGGVDQEVIFEIGRLTACLVETLQAQETEAVLTHAYEGGHPDHDAAALMANLAVSRLPQAARPELFEMTSYHARDGRCVSGEFLPAQQVDEICLELSAQEQQRKRRMMDEYGSQRLVLENFPIRSERIRRAPTYDFSRPPHPGKLWYECMGWPLAGARWRELAVQALSESEEQACR
ncbi:MAG: PIG-L family deacetylase [Acidobacteriaceae bacterium]|nr:PIG-L family deacetylase [Acidobacteriota bacterium]MBV9442271.1 PIG-L family deacetylase [Acidobacteriaceae bacterium]